jgi:hypothetical protein
MANPLYAYKQKDYLPTKGRFHMSFIFKSEKLSGYRNGFQLSFLTNEEIRKQLSRNGGTVKFFFRLFTFSLYIKKEK